MTRDGAIKVLEYKTKLAQFWNDPTMLEAIHLGIEALKVIKGYREIQPISYPKLLPGETEE